MTNLYLATAVLAALLLIAAAIDIRTMRIPNALNAAIAAAGLLATWLLQRDIVAALLGLGLGYGFIVLANLIYRTVRGRDGVGMGDAKLLGGAGAWVGWAGLPFVVLIASAAGIVYVAGLRLVGKPVTGTHALPFGPFLCAAIMIVWVVQVA
jgi:leader peptidase (prepilin peptidase)/N-methyltransferase